MGPSNASPRDQRKDERRGCSLYMRLVDHQTGEAVGDLADISQDGFRLETSKSVRVNRVFKFHADLPPDVSNKPFMVFVARCRWCRVDPIDSRLYDTGFEILEMDPEDQRLFKLIFERYGSKRPSNDYFWGR